MEKNSSVNMVDTLNTTGSSSSSFAYSEDQIVIPEKLAEPDVSKQQHDKSNVEFSEEAKSTDASEEQDKTAFHTTNKEFKLTEESIEEEKRADDSNQEGKPTNGMETKWLDNLVDDLSTTGFYSLYVAYPEEKIIIDPENLEEHDASEKQQDKSHVESSKEEKSTDVSKEQEKTAIHSNKDGNLTAESIYEEKRADDPNQDDKPINGLEKYSSEQFIDALNTTCSSSSFLPFPRSKSLTQKNLKSMMPRRSRKTTLTSNAARKKMVLTTRASATSLRSIRTSRKTSLTSIRTWKTSSWLASTNQMHWTSSLQRQLQQRRPASQL
jgi:hypothetical protein